MTVSKRKNKNLLILLSILFTFFDLLFLYFLKYRNQSLSLSEFSFNYFGNILNLIITFLLALGITLIHFKKESKISSSFTFNFTLGINAVLILAAAATFIKFPFPQYYIFNHPINDVFIGLLFSSFQFLQFILLSIIWLNLLGKNNFVFFRSIINSIFIVALLLIISYIYLSRKIENYNSNNSINNKIKVAVVLGAAVWSDNKPSPSLASRVDKAVEFYKKKLIDKIQLTGSNAPGEMSEARVALNYINSKDVNDRNIWIEEKTTSTSEQIKFIKNELLIKNHIENVIIISDSYHLARVKEMCSFYNIKASVVMSDLKLSTQNNLYYKFRESIALIIFWLFAL